MSISWRMWGALALVLAGGRVGWAAPLVEGAVVPSWVRDAIAQLTAQGLIEGYPDGTFKGDRSATRWEAAAVVARLLARLETKDAQLLTKAQLDEVKRLVDALGPELDGLGARVKGLEENVGRLDQRVTELERIKFYGRFEARLVDQTFYNQGANNNNINNPGTGPKSGVPFVDYNQAVGTLTASKWRPQTNGVIPTVDYTNGRPLTNGVGSSSLAILGLRTGLGNDWLAEVEFAAYSSQGDFVTNAYWGVSAPYLTNPLTASAAGGDEANTPYTRMALDHVRLENKSSKTLIVLGTLPSLWIDPIVYAGQTNNSIYGPRRFPGYGIMARGQADLDEVNSLKWEAFGSRLGNGVVYQGTGYNYLTWGGDLAWEFPHGALRLNFAHLAEDAPSGGGLLVEGLISGLNVAYGNSSGWSVRQWVNPPGYFANQSSALEANAGKVVKGVFQPGTSDTRPIVGWNGNADNTIGITTGAGNFGPEEQSAWGVSGRYKFDLDKELGHSLQLSSEVAQSVYRPNKNSTYESHGSSFRAQLEASFWKDQLVFNLSYLRGDANYQPAGWNSDISGLRSPILGNYVGSFHLYDNVTYRHNRTGPRASLKWQFDDNHGSLALQAASLAQTQTSLYDVRYSPQALGPGGPNFPVLGFSPGYVEAVFWGYATPNQYGPHTANSFTDSLQPMEDPRGYESNLGFTFNYRWDQPQVDLSLHAEQNHYWRHTSLTPGLGGSQNEVDLKSSYANLLVGWRIDRHWKIRAGLDYVYTLGHLDPAGLYNRFAIATNSSTFANIGSVQWIPSLGADLQLSPDSQADFTVRHFNSRDLLGGDVFSGLVATSNIGLSTHPFNWQGWQISTGYSVKF